MELWIRSQDRIDLIKACSIGIQAQNEDDFVIYNSYSHGYDELGVYKTKERALEVLDEMQMYISEKYAEVYEMPEE